MSGRVADGEQPERAQGRVARARAGLKRAWDWLRPAGRTVSEAVTEASLVDRLLRHWLWVVLLITSAILFLLAPRFGAYVAVAALLLAGFGLFIAPLQLPGSYWLVVPATMVIFAALVLIARLTFLGDRLEYVLYLWLIPFPVGLGVGLYMWLCLDSDADRRLLGGTRSAARATVRFGLELCWVLFTWAYVVLNVAGFDPEQRQLVAALLGIAAVLIGVLLWRLEQPPLSTAAHAVGRRLVALRNARQAELAHPYYLSSLSFYNDFKEIWEGSAEFSEKRKELQAMGQRMPANPPLYDYDIKRRVLNIRLAEQYVFDALGANLSESRQAAYVQDGLETWYGCLAELGRWCGEDKLKPDEPAGTTVLVRTQPQAVPGPA